MYVVNIAAAMVAFTVSLLRCFAVIITPLMITQVSPTTQTAAPVAVANEAFGVGEELFYNVSYKSIIAGTGSFRIGRQMVERNGVPCYDINFEVQSLKSLEWIYRLKNTFRTLVDIQYLLPKYCEQHNREGNYRRDFWAEFDHKACKARTSEGEFGIESNTHDVVSAFFYVRTLNLKTKQRGDVITLKQFSDRQVYDLVVRVLGRQTVSVEAGTFQCIVIEPLVREGGLFKNEGRILIWLTDDDRKVPVKVSSKILIGSVDVELTMYKGLRGPLAAKIDTSKQSSQEQRP